MKGPALWLPETLGYSPLHSGLTACLATAPEPETQAAVQPLPAQPPPGDWPARPSPRVSRHSEIAQEEADGGTQQGPTETPSLCWHQRWRASMGTRSPVCGTTGRRPHSGSPALGTASRPPPRGRGLPTPAVAAGRLTCVAVGPLHVQLHVALLREAHDTVVTLVRPLPRVLLHVHLQRALLVKSLLAERAVERPLP